MEAEKAETGSGYSVPEVSQLRESSVGELQADPRFSASTCTVSVGGRDASRVAGGTSGWLWRGGGDEVLSRPPASRGSRQAAKPGLAWGLWARCLIGHFCPIRPPLGPTLPLDSVVSPYSVVLSHGSGHSACLAVFHGRHGPHVSKARIGLYTQSTTAASPGGSSSRRHNLTSCTQISAQK